jgi:D-serine deaminase-like pyridoxal phosphate-dependent protein
MMSLAVRPLLTAPTAIPTPALLIDLDRVDANIAAMIAQCGSADRWRPHVKTAKAAVVMQRYLAQGVTHFKCATTKELAVLLQLGAPDVLLAFPALGATATRARALLAAAPATRGSILVESAAHLEAWQGSGVGVFLDLNPGMDRTGSDPSAVRDVRALIDTVTAAGCKFRGIHWYDGHLAGAAESGRDAVGFAGYDRLLGLVAALQADGVRIGEIIVAGTPATPVALRYARWAETGTSVRVSPGTVVFNDRTSLAQLPAVWGLTPAATVLTTVVSHPRAGRVTTDAGHKSVSADAGVPTCVVIGHWDWAPAKPSEEHLPIDLPPGAAVPPIGTMLELLATHICPTVNNFDEAVLVRDGRVVGTTPIDARGHDGMVTR